MAPALVLRRLPGTGRGGVTVVDAFGTSSASPSTKLMPPCLHQRGHMNRRRTNPLLRSAPFFLLAVAEDDDDGPWLVPSTSARHNNNDNLASETSNAVGGMCALVVATTSSLLLLGGTIMTAAPLPAEAAATTTTAATTSATPSSPFFRQAQRPFLTSPILEQYRIWDQEVADNLKHGGELERGDAANKGRVDAYPSLLVPILKVQDDLQTVQSLVSSSTSVGVSEWKQALAIVSQPSYETKALKATFNKYGDNIYYNDPDRANLYLGGGASPKNEQSLAYLLRNDLLTCLQNLKSELEYCLSVDESNAQQDNDVTSYARQAVTSLQKYLDLVPPVELERARALMVSSAQASRPQLSE